METVDFNLEAVNFPYMPSVFMIEVGPDYNEKLNYIAAHDSGANCEFAELSKEDRRWGICGVDLIVNTNGASHNMPLGGGGETIAAQG